MPIPVDATSILLNNDNGFTFMSTTMHTHTYTDTHTHTHSISIQQHSNDIKTMIVHINNMDRANHHMNQIIITQHMINMNVAIMRRMDLWIVKVTCKGRHDTSRDCQFLHGIITLCSEYWQHIKISVIQIVKQSTMTAPYNQTIVIHWMCVFDQSFKYAHPHIHIHTYVYAHAHEHMNWWPMMLGSVANHLILQHRHNESITWVSHRHANNTHTHGGCTRT